jgi:hypothetical protein
MSTKHGYTLNLRGGYQYEVTADHAEYITHLKQFVAQHDDLLAALRGALKRLEAANKHIACDDEIAAARAAIAQAEQS